MPRRHQEGENGRRGDREPRMDDQSGFLPLSLSPILPPLATTAVLPHAANTNAQQRQTRLHRLDTARIGCSIGRWSPGRVAERKRLLLIAIDRRESRATAQAACV